MERVRECSTENRFQRESYPGQVDKKGNIVSVECKSRLGEKESRACRLIEARASRDWKENGG